MKLGREARHFSFLVLCALLCACVALPDREQIETVQPPRPADGALLAKRWAQSSLNLPAMAALEHNATTLPLIPGNKVTLLFDGPQTMAEMFKAINAASNHINLETYIFDQDELGQKFAALLIAKQRAGVHVSILYDSVGTIGVPQAFFDQMRDAGIQLLAFNPVNPAKLHGNAWKINQRDHRKVLIVDGKIAFTGGVNISASYARSSLFRSRAKARAGSQVGWRDTHVKIEGPAVAALQWHFIQAWVRQDAVDLPDALFFPALRPLGDKPVRVIASAPGGAFDIYKAYILAIEQAKKSIHITSAYFVPDPQTMAALSAAAQRGVDVKLVLPGVSDSELVFHAGRAAYQRLLDSGVRIYELQIAVLHAKTAVIDGVWSTVGSTNIDVRSFLHNSELNIVVQDAAFGAEMESAFQEDIRDSHPITSAEWGRRPLANRLKEWAARLMDYWL